MRRAAGIRGMSASLRISKGLQAFGRTRQSRPMVRALATVIELAGELAAFSGLQFRPSLRPRRCLANMEGARGIRF
jgi:hypothetical protein